MKTSSVETVRSGRTTPRKNRGRGRVLPHRVRPQAPIEPTAPEPREAAASAGLRYVTDHIPGIGRRRVGSGFRYVTPQGSTVRGKELERIHKLAIPPAWRDVWICPDSRGHLQATGRDARGRKQHRYHPRWRQVRDEAKYGRILEFAAALPGLRKRAAADLSGPALSRRKVVAAVVQLLEKTLIRVGNDEYARDNHSFGLTTLQDGHAHVTRSTVRFRFKGKSGKFHDIALSDARLARVVRRCQELPGRELFQYLDDDGEVQDIGSADVNEYLRDATGRDFTAKDFRTWLGTVLAARALQEMKAFSSTTQAKRNVLAAVETVAGTLGNTRAICRKCYIHPGNHRLLHGPHPRPDVERARRRAARQIRIVNERHRDGRPRAPAASPAAGRAAEVGVDRAGRRSGGAQQRDAADDGQHGNRLGHGERLAEEERAKGERERRFQAEHDDVGGAEIGAAHGKRLQRSAHREEQQEAGHRRTMLQAVGALHEDAAQCEEERGERRQDEPHRVSRRRQPFGTPCCSSRHSARLSRLTATRAWAPGGAARRY